MTLQAFPAPKQGHGGVGFPVEAMKAIAELQGLKVDVIDGAAAGTNMTVAGLRPDDTLVAAIRFNDTWAAPVSDLANITIQPRKASGTITVSGTPAADGVVVVNGVTYTFKARANCTDVRHVAMDDADESVTTLALKLSNAINAYEKRYLEPGGYATPVVTASPAAGVITVTAVAEGTGGNALTLTKTATNVSVSGAGTLAGGLADGAIRSTTNLSTATLVLVWFDKAA